MTRSLGKAAEKSQESSRDGGTAGSKDKGNPQKMGNRQEGQYDKQDDDATMRPSKAEEHADNDE